MNNPVETILGQATIEALKRPAGKAFGLPGAAFTSDAFHTLENERLFPRTWTAAGVASDIPNPGDALPVTVAGLPLVLVRDREAHRRALYQPFVRKIARKIMISMIPANDHLVKVRKPA